MRRLIIGLCIVSLAGCTVGPDYTPPDGNLPDVWNDPSTQQASPPGRSNVTTLSNPDPEWWKSFQDPELTSLIQRSISGNLPLQQAVLRITEARQQEITAEAAGLPHLGANASYMREQEGLRGLANESGANSYNFGGSGAAAGNGAGSAGGSSNILNRLFNPFSLFQDSLNATWEIDLFGRVRRAAEEAEANTRMTVAEHNATLVSLEAQVAQTYAQFRGAQAQQRIEQEDEKVEQGIVELTQRRFKQGLSSYLDVDNAQTQLETTTASLPQFQQQLQVAANSLCLLLGLPPGALDKELTATQSVPLLPPDIPIGMPSELGKRREDVRQAAEQLHMATAALGVAVAQTYPDLNLTGEVGTRALELKGLGEWANLFYAAGPTATLPIFEGGQLTANIEMATAEQSEAALNFRQTVLTGLNQVESALAAYRADRARQISLAQTVKTSQDGLYLAQNRYEHGLSTFIDVLTTENQLVTARQQYTDSALAVTEDVVTLYRSLGGGWENQPNTKDPTPEGDAVLEHVIEQ